MAVAPGLKEQLAAATQKQIDLRTPTPTPTPNPQVPYTGMMAQPDTNKYSVPTLPQAAVTAANNTPQPQVPMPSSDYFSKNWGSKDHYVESQQDRYNTAVTGGDTGLAQRLLDDAKRVGYTLNAPVNKQLDQTPIPSLTPNTAQNGPFQYNPSSNPTVPVWKPSIPTMDEAAIRAYAEAQVAQKLKDARLTADQSINSNKLTAQQQSDALKANYDKMYADITENRNVENVENDRRLSPFSGRSDYALGMVEQNRARTDRENESTLQTNQANIASQAALLQQQINDKYYALEQAAPNEKEALFQSIKNDERQYDLMVQGSLRDDALANSQLGNTAFNQQLQQFQTNYGVQQDKIRNDAEYGGTYNNDQTYAAKQQQIQNDAQYGGIYGQGQSLQGKASDLANKQANWGAYGDVVNWTQNLGKGPADNWSNLVNNANAGTKTAAGQQQDTANKQWQDSFDRSKYESDREYRNKIQQQSISNGQWQQQFNQDVQKLGFQQASELWSQAFQENQANQNDAYRKQTLEQSMTQQDRDAATQATTAIKNSGLVTTTTDPKTGQQSMSVTNPDTLNKYIKSLNLSDNATDALLYQYGLDSYVKK